jgi:glycosyltransferase involved in cell wall biosynthesis
MATAGTFRVLFIEKSIGLSGSTMSLCSLLNALDRTTFEPHIVVSKVEQAAYLRGRLQEAVPIAIISPAESLKNVRLVKVGLELFGARFLWLRRGLWRLLALADLLYVTIPYAWRLRRFARGRDIAMIHQNNGFDEAAFFVSRALGVPLLAYQRGNEWDSGLVRRLACRVDRYVANSRATKVNLSALGVNPERITVIYPPVDPGLFKSDRRSPASRDGFGIGASAPCFGIVGMLLEWKGHRTFLKAAERVLKRIPNAYALIVGEAPGSNATYEGELIALARELGIRDRVVFTGFRSDIPEVMALMDVVVHASVQPEPFGRVIAEAMALGKPVVASDAGGPREIIEHGRTGFLVPPGDDEKLADTIVGLLKDRALAQRVGEEAYREAIRRFSAELQAELIQDVYTDVLGRVNRAAVTPSGFGRAGQKPKEHGPS